MSGLIDMAAAEAAKRYPDHATPENGYLGSMPQVDDFTAGATWLANLEPPVAVLDAMYAMLRGDRPDEEQGRDLYEVEKLIVDDWRHKRISDEEMWLRLHRAQMRRMWKAGMEAML